MALKIPDSNSKEIKKDDNSKGVKSEMQIQDKITKTIRIDADLVENLEKMAIKNRYNFSVAVNTALARYFDDELS